VVISGIILSSTGGEEIVPITYSTSEPFSFQQSYIRSTQVKNFPWIHDSTQAQFFVKNTDTQEGSFTLNYKFDNGSKTETKTKKVKILAGEEKAVSLDSTLRGKSSVILDVIPPSKLVVHQGTKTIKHSGWYYLRRLAPFIK
jgi:hypothetical protein